MLDVQVPHPKHTWKDLLFYIASIVAGLIVVDSKNLIVSSLICDGERKPVEVPSLPGAQMRGTRGTQP
jgi:hypothetical protein